MELNQAHVMAGPTVSQDVLHAADERFFAALEQLGCLPHSFGILPHQLSYPFFAYSIPIGAAAAAHSVLHQLQNALSAGTQPLKSPFVQLQHFAKVLWDKQCRPQKDFPAVNIQLEEFALHGIESDKVQ